MPRGKAEKSLQLIDAARDILSAIQPASVRGVCYKLFTLGHISSMEKRNVQRVSEQLKYAREAGIIPWEWIVDETREVEAVSTWRDPDSILSVAADTYKRDLWHDQPFRVEVWSEKGTVRGVVQPVLNEFRVPFRVHHGFSSATAIYDAAQESVKDERPLVALYLGDRDPSGMGMSVVDLPKRITRYGGDVHLKRIAITEADTATGIPWFDVDTKKADTRYRWFRELYGKRCYELDALDPRILRTRLRENILAFMDEGLWERGMQFERVERESMCGFLNSWREQKSISGPDRK